MTFQEYINERKTIYPEPVRKLVGLDWRFYASVTVSIAAVILAALRTGQIFYAAAVLSSAALGIEESGLAELIPVLDFVVALVAIEGGLVVYAAIRAKEHGKVKPWVYTTMIGLLVVISVMAGLSQALNLTDISEDIARWFMYALSIVLGAGASLVAWLSGEVLGVQALRYEEAAQQADQRYERQTKAWLAAARKDWRIDKKQPVTPKVVDAPKPHKGRLHERILKHVEQVVATEQRFPSEQEIAKATGASVSYVRGVLAEWKERL